MPLVVTKRPTVVLLHHKKESKAREAFDSLVRLQRLGLLPQTLIEREGSVVKVFGGVTADIIPGGEDGSAD